MLAVIYLIFNEGYSATAGTLVRDELCDEAIRLGKLLAVLMPDEPEAFGLLALMLLHDSRRDPLARRRARPAEDQDRSRWDRDEIDEGMRALDRALRMRRPGPYQFQAAIAAVHAEAEQPADTDWPGSPPSTSSSARIDPSPVVELNRAVAVALADGPEEGLA